MKRFILFLLVGLFAIILTSCSFFGDDDVNVTAYEKIYVDNNQEALYGAIDEVSEANVVLASKYKKNYGAFQYTYTYDLKSAVIYKAVGNVYYVVTFYQSGDEDAKAYSVIVNADYENSYDAFMVGYDVLNRVAVYTFTSSLNLVVSEISQTFDNEVGDQVFTIGTQANEVSSISSFDFEQYSSNLNVGIISNDNGFEIMSGTMSTDDNRGSGLYDYSGKLVGLNIYKISTSIEYGASYIPGEEGLLDASGMCYAIRCDKLYTIVLQIENYHNVSRLSLGFDISKARELNPSSSDYSIFSYYLREYSYVYGLEEQPYIDYANGNDVLFSFPENVTSGLYLYSTGQSSDFNLQKGDFIVGINGIEVRTLYDFIKEFNVLLSTDTVTLSIYRNGNPMNITN